MRNARHNNHTKSSLASLAAGINFFDTAPEYGYGLSERRLGDALRLQDRSNWILATKVGEILSAKHTPPAPASRFVNPLPFHLQHDYSYDGILSAFEASLQRLGLNQIDVLFVHDLDPVIHSPLQFEKHFKHYIEEGYRALAELRAEGLIKAIGLGVKQWEVCQTAMMHGDYDCFMLQGNFTLLEQSALNTFLPECKKKNISV